MARATLGDCCSPLSKAFPNPKVSLEITPNAIAASGKLTKAIAAVMAVTRSCSKTFTL